MLRIPHISIVGMRGCIHPPQVSIKQIFGMTIINTNGFCLVNSIQIRDDTISICYLGWRDMQVVRQFSRY